ncbi:MAG: lactate utilization protein C [Bacteroidota bacterium]
MNISASKEIILKKIRRALTHKVPLPFPGTEGNNSVFNPPYDDLAVQFAEAFTALEGKFIFCDSEKAAVDQLMGIAAGFQWNKLFCKEPHLIHLIHQSFPGFSFYNDLSGCDVSVTGCELLVSRTGSVVLSAAQEHGRTSSVYAPVHSCIAYTRQLVHDLKDALAYLKNKYGSQLPSSISFATGPSRTADIEKTLVVGVHGPGQVYVILVDEG